MSRALWLVLVGVSVLCLSACNTFAGMGKDVEKVGESMQRVTK